MEDNEWWKLAFHNPPLFITLFQEKIHYRIPSSTREGEGGGDPIEIDEHYVAFRIKAKCFPVLLELLKNNCVEIQPLWPDTSLVVIAYNEELLDKVYERGKHGFLRDFGFE